MIPRTPARAGRGLCRLFAAGAMVVGAMAQADTTELVSISTAGVQGNRFSETPVVSANGRFVAFRSFATNLVTGDTNGFYDIFVRDLEMGTTERVSVSSSGQQGSGLGAESPSISADGRFVAFRSFFSNLVPGDTNTNADVFVHDRDTGETTRVSVSTDGVETPSGAHAPSISGDGCMVAFHSSGNNLVPDDTNLASDVFVHDRDTGVTKRVSVSSDGVQGNSFSDRPSISGNGRFVAFRSAATNLVAGGSNGWYHIYVHDLDTGVTERVSVSSSGILANKDVADASMSADGRFVVFSTDANNLVPDDSNASSDIFVHDRQSGLTERVSVDSSGTQGNAGSWRPSISADGRFVAFDSVASNLVDSDTNNGQDVFLHDRQTGRTTRISLSSSGVEGNSYSRRASVSADGMVVAYESNATNLVAVDANGWEDIFVTRRTRKVDRDFDHDGKTDLFWRHSGSGRNVIWFMDGAARTGAADTLGLNDPDWELAGFGDFDGDGRADILWRSQSTGRNVIWFMDGATRTGSSDTTPLNHPDWELSALRDFDGDGRTDLLWRNTQNGRNVIWFMDGATRTGSGDTLGLNDPDWELAGFGDFDGDGRADILWRSQSTGRNVIWLMDGLDRIGHGDTVVLNDPSWTIMGLEDFDGDGRTDFLWRNTQNGRHVMWFMDGATRTGSGDTVGLNHPDWSLTGFGDYNGDGRSDFLWHNEVNGRNVMWFMDGTTRIGAGDTVTLPFDPWFPRLE